MRYPLFAAVFALASFAGTGAAQGPRPSTPESPVSFRNEIMPLFARGGCNQGACHGNLNGKGGFKLSLRGWDAEFDHRSVTREQQGRRLNLNDPDQSLLVLKATGVVSHEGGVRFQPGSFEAKLLERWIAEGTPNDLRTAPTVVDLAVGDTERFIPVSKKETRIAAVATFSDGRKKDVRSLAVFESTNPKVEPERSGVVRSDGPAEMSIVIRYAERQAVVQLAFVPDRLDFAWTTQAATNPIDAAVYDRLKKLSVAPSAKSSDSEFLRRVFIDMLGVLPTADEARAFLADKSNDKREKLIDRLLARPEFSDHWAQHWGDVLRNEEKQLDRKGVRVFHGWIRKQIEDDVPLTEFARSLLLARGSTYANPPANFFRALRDTQTRAEAVAQVFLGLRMQCARCHNHPFNRWTQSDYHQFAAFFPQIDYKIVSNVRRDKLDKHEFNGEQIVNVNGKNEHAHPVTKENLAPRLLGANGVSPKSGDRIVALANWVAAPTNPFFGRTQANRIWSHLVGRGVVEPNDDFRESNPPSNERLLDVLVARLSANGFRLKPFVREIVLSQTYQNSSMPNETNADDETNFSHALVRSLPAETLLDAIAQVTETATTFDGYPQGTRAGQLAGPMPPRRGSRGSESERFLRAFGKPERILSCDCERSEATTVNQALLMISGPLVNDSITAEKNRLSRLLKANVESERILDELFLATLSRFPTATERDGLLSQVRSAPNVRLAWEDVTWALLNSKEFLLRR